MTLTEFLLARLDEDEYATLDPQPLEWLWLDLRTPAMKRRQRAHERRVFAEVEAKRRIVHIHRAIGAGVCTTCDEMVAQDDWRHPAHPCETLRLLAQQYADHPDYRREWTTR